METIFAGILVAIFIMLVNRSSPSETNNIKVRFKHSENQPTNIFNCYNKKTVLTYREKIFYRHLKQKIRPEFIIIPQAVISSFISCKYKKYRTKIDKKTVDFLIVDYEFEPIIAIELDDKSHLRPDRIERDRFVNQLMYDTNIKIARIEVGKSYINEIEQKLAEII